jgi:Protein of unknown function (DUF1559)
MQCASNLKQIALGLHNYADAHRDAPSSQGFQTCFPAGTVAHPDLPPEQRLSWFVELLPYLEQNDLARRLDRGAGWADSRNAAVIHTPVKVLRCADWAGELLPAEHLTPYLGAAGLGADAANLPATDRRAGVFGHNRRTALTEVTDGTSNTLLVLESARDNGPWARGGPSTVRGLDPTDRPHLGVGRPFGGTHFAEKGWSRREQAIGCQAALADGSCRFLTNDVSPQVLEALVTVAGGEQLPGDW